MRQILIAAALSLGGGACHAQAAPGTPPAAAKFHTGSSTIRPIDKGPYTPQANAAYQGGGVILQGAPGAPAPLPQPTPPRPAAQKFGSAWLRPAFLSRE